MNFLLVGLGGAIGSMARYGVGLVLAGTAFPLATLVVNVIGCFCIGLALPALDRGRVLAPDMRLLIVVGFLGGFTTFSAFGYESVTLMRTSSALAAINIAANVLLGLAAVIAGSMVASGWQQA